ncbi:23S rRNA (uracil(1939)-C(5))-methyltransferase RlmD [Butyrivibrio sp. MC2013]|uniref:23S rRNA (uracil(1939)-C(5))-methyltransferase RlmD n=1 Tax=Butyrivibrio sp. MC2013 TaxID=1280686 RepID=UPI0009DC2495|nr:23S rRNA (uracil(1939)-C(5))-methyltransferase RlmD [Butyrivibrio sp. MC2013]
MMKKTIIKKEKTAGAKEKNTAAKSSFAKNSASKNKAAKNNAAKKSTEKNSIAEGDSAAPKKKGSRCPYFKKCGGCHYIDTPYKEQLKLKKKHLQGLLSPYCKVEDFIAMEDPDHYRCKVHAVFTHDRKGNPLSGIYQESSHKVVPVEYCLLEDQKADEIIATIRGLLKSFKIRTYDEDYGQGLFRHILIRVGKNSGQIMVVLVVTSPIFPSSKNFVKALLEKHPEITTVVLNINDRHTSMILGDRFKTLYGKGYILDTVCGLEFKMSPASFYQVNPVQTQKMYSKAIELAGLTGDELALDCYSGVGTIGLIASSHVREVISVEINGDAVKDAIWNAKNNKIENVTFYKNDATRFMQQMAAAGDKADVVFMDPPRNGSTEEFLTALFALLPSKVVYISCGPDSLARDLKFLTAGGYKVDHCVPVDMFCHTRSIETIVTLSKR